MINLLKDVILLNIAFPLIPINLFKHLLIRKIYNLRSSLICYLAKPELQTNPRLGELQSITTKLAHSILILKYLGKRYDDLPDNIVGDAAKQKESTHTISVSVIIPVYNVSKYLSECLDSIINQSLKNIEIICINDGSTDNSSDILNSYAQKDDRLIVIQQSNSGQGASRNTGVRMAKGEYIYFMDSDDILDIKALEYMHDEASKSNLDVIYCDGISFYESEQLKDKFPLYQTMYTRPKEFSEVTPGQILFRNMVRNKCFTNQVCLHLCKKDYLLRHNIFFEEGVIFEDVDFSLKLILQASRASHRKKQFFKRRVRDNSTMTSANEQRTRQFIDYFTCFWHMLFFLKEKKFNKRSQVAILAHLWPYLISLCKHFQTMEQISK